MGGRDLQPEGIIGAIENMLPEASTKTILPVVDFIGMSPSPQAKGLSGKHQDLTPSKNSPVHGSGVEPHAGQAQ